MTIKDKRLAAADGGVLECVEIGFEPGEVQEWILHPTINDGSILLERRVLRVLIDALADYGKSRRDDG